MFCQSNLLFGLSGEKIRGRNAKFRAPKKEFRGSEFLFRGSYEKIPVQKRFRGGSGAVFSSRWNFFPDTFPVSFCQRNPPAGFPAGRVSAPGVSRVPSKGQVWRGFRDILISTRRVWLRFFRAVPARRLNTRISEGENEQIVNAHPEVSFCQCKDVRRGHRAEIRIMSSCRGTNPKGAEGVSHSQGAIMAVQFAIRTEVSLRLSRYFTMNHGFKRSSLL